MTLNSKRRGPFQRRIVAAVKLATADAVSDVSDRVYRSAGRIADRN
jgi:hypothetical protein